MIEIRGSWPRRGQSRTDVSFLISDPTNWGGMEKMNILNLNTREPDIYPNSGSKKGHKSLNTHEMMIKYDVIYTLYLGGMMPTIKATQFNNPRIRCRWGWYLSSCPLRSRIVWHRTALESALLGWLLALRSWAPDLDICLQ